MSSNAISGSGVPDALGVGVIGCGRISNQYLEKMKLFPILDMRACADVIHDRAREQAQAYGIPKACSPGEILDDADIDIVVNLTPPQYHSPINMDALQAGKHVYTEKPFAVDRRQAAAVLDLAASKGLRIGSAPDTFLGGGLQTSRKLLSEGVIGEPVAAVAFLASWGPEKGRHPQPAFFFKPGGGPMLDMGPYYVTALVNLLGPVDRVSGSARISVPERIKRNEPNRGEKYIVETPTHITGTIDFESGPVGTIITSFDVPKHTMPRLEIYGTKGTLRVPDPNTFWGPVAYWVDGAEDWQEAPLTFGYADRFRGLGVADMAYGIRTGRPHRASGELAFHVLDVLLGFVDSSEQGRHITIDSTCSQPTPLPEGLADGYLDR